VIGKKGLEALKGIKKARGALDEAHEEALKGIKKARGALDEARVVALRSTCK